MAYIQEKVGHWLLGGKYYATVREVHFPWDLQTMIEDLVSESLKSMGMSIPLLASLEGPPIERGVGPCSLKLGR